MDEQAHVMRRRFKKNNNSSSNTTALEITLHQRIRHPQASELYRRISTVAQVHQVTAMIADELGYTDALSARLQVALSSISNSNCSSNNKIITPILPKRRIHRSHRSNQHKNAKSPTSSSSSCVEVIHALGAFKCMNTEFYCFDERVKSATTSSSISCVVTPPPPTTSTVSIVPRTPKPFDSLTATRQHQINSSSSSRRRPQTRSSSPLNNNNTNRDQRSPATSSRDADAWVASLTPQPAAQAGSQYQRSTLNYAQEPLVKLVKTELDVDPTDLSKTTWADFIRIVDLAKRSLQESAILSQFVYWITTTSQYLIVWTNRNGTLTSKSLSEAEELWSRRCFGWHGRLHHPSSFWMNSMRS